MSGSTTVSFICTYGCGEQVVYAISVLVFPDAWSALCPSCHKDVVRDFRNDERLRRELVSAGATCAAAPLLCHSDAPPLVLDDLIDLHFELESL